MGSLGQLGTWVFTFVLCVALLLNWLCCMLLSLLRRGILSVEKAEGLALMSTKLWWRFAIGSCFWVRTINMSPGAWKPFMDELAAADAAAKMGAPRQPVYVMSNHCSFLDAMLLTMHMPPAILWRTRVYFASHLLKFPFLSTICRVQGHFPVHFLRSDEGHFSLDKERMAAVEERVTAHVQRGGILQLFPEGNLNRGADTSKLQTFRHGTFKRAVDENARIWFFVMTGNEKVWPVNRLLAFQPARTGFALYAVFKPGEGAAAALAGIRASSPGGLSCESRSGEDGVILAEWAKRDMEAKHAQLKRQVDAANHGCGGGCCYVECGSSARVSDITEGEKGGGASGDMEDMERGTEQPMATRAPEAAAAAYASTAQAADTTESRKIIAVRPPPKSPSDKPPPPVPVLGTSLDG